MTIEEIFSKLSAHMVKGLMIHDKIAQAYNFLNLKGYKKCHEYHYFSESYNYKCLQNYYLEQYRKLIPEEKFEEPEIIPAKWYAYSKEDVDTNTKRNAVKEMMKMWVDWEQETKKTLESSYKELYEMGEICAAKKISKFLADVDMELKSARNKYINLETIGYDITAIVKEQKDLHKKYEKKIKCIYSKE